jgi:RecA-family ATPase
MREPRLPSLWRAKSYTVEPVSPPDDIHVLQELIEAQERHENIAFYVTRTEFGSAWSIAMFIGGRFWKSFPASDGTLANAIEWAERLASYFPGSFVVGEESRAKAVTLNPMKASDLAGKEVEPRRWHVRDMIPAGDITSLYGDGGTGKTMIALQLAVATVLGTPWMGKRPMQGRCLFLSAEEDIDELHRRLATIVAAEGVKLSDLGDLNLVSLAGEDAMLAMLEDDGRTMQPTPLFDMLAQRVRDDPPTLLLVESLADVFPGDENNKLHTRQFVTLLRSLALTSKAAVVVLAHPSAAGMASGFGTSGNTAWSNSVRSRLYFERIYTSGKDGKAQEADPTVRTLNHKKTNYGPLGASLRLRWQDGVFVTDERLALPAPKVDAGQATKEVAERVDAKFLELLAAFATEGRNVSDAGPTYAPTRFAKDPRADGIKKAAFVDAMNRLFSTRRIAMVEYGPQSNSHRRIEAVK